MFNMMTTLTSCTIVIVHLVIFCCGLAFLLSGNIDTGSIHS